MKNIIKTLGGIMKVYTLKAMSSIFLICIICFMPYDTNATENIPIIENHLSEDKLRYYSDPLDSFRTDLWDPSQWTSNEEQMSNFKRADFKFVDGKLFIETKKGY